MKKTIITLVLALVAIAAMACEPPTSHMVIKVGATYDYNFTDKVNGVDNIGIGGTIGYEIPMRWLTIEADGGYVFGTKNWHIGGGVELAPLPMTVSSPIVPKILLNSGYNSHNKVYASVGLELTLGYNTQMFVPYINTKVGFETETSAFTPTYGLTAEIGFRLWLGKSGW